MAPLGAVHVSVKVVCLVSAALTQALGLAAAFVQEDAEELTPLNESPSVPTSAHEAALVALHVMAVDSPERTRSGIAESVIEGGATHEPLTQAVPPLHEYVLLQLSTTEVLLAQL
jgi:hypothetical protein